MVRRRRSGSDQGDESVAPQSSPSRAARLPDAIAGPSDSVIREEIVIVLSLSLLASAVFAVIDLLSAPVSGVTRAVYPQVGLATQLGISFLWGYAFIHYYLDSKIWRVRRDPSVGKALNMN